MRTPRPLIDAVLRSVTGRVSERLVPLSGGGMNETYRADLAGDRAVVVRIARQQGPWFVDEARLIAQAGEAGVPTARVYGVEHHDHDGEPLSFAVLDYLPGRTLDQLVTVVPAAEIERLVVDAGELLARIHRVLPEAGRGLRHELRNPTDDALAVITDTVERAVGPAATRVVADGAQLLRRVIASRPTAPFTLAQGDFMPKNLVVDAGTIVGVIDWEFAGPAPTAFDLARWEVSAGAPFDDRPDLLRRGYARVADPEAAAGLLAAYTIDWTFELLAWRNPASPAEIRRAVAMIAHRLR